MKNHFLKNFSGFTLVETMVVIVIFVMASAAIFSVEFYAHKLYGQQESIAEINQNGRVVIERFTREIRQARKITNTFSDNEAAALSSISFEDGHVSSAYETSAPQAVATTTITLAATASSANDFYKDTFVEIISGWGNADNKVRKISGYDGATKTATLDRPWQDPFPTTGSVYKIDSSYYYINYFASSTEVYREVQAFYFPSDPDTYLPYNATSTSEILTIQQLEEPRIIGEYVQSLKFWGGRIINVKIDLAKDGQTLELQTKIFGRNL